jgi:hypothetical protein
VGEWVCNLANVRGYPSLLAGPSAWELKTQNWAQKQNKRQGAQEFETYLLFFLEIFGDFQVFFVHVEKQQKMR